MIEVYEVNHGDILTHVYRWQTQTMEWSMG
mgnify:CR=1 FL=1